MANRPLHAPRQLPVSEHRVQCGLERRMLEAETPREQLGGNTRWPSTSSGGRAPRRTGASAATRASAAPSGGAAPRPGSSVNSALVTGFGRGEVDRAGDRRRARARAGSRRFVGKRDPAHVLLPEPMRPPRPSLNGNSMRVNAPPPARGRCRCARTRHECRRRPPASLTTSHAAHTSTRNPSPGPLSSVSSSSPRSP